MDKQHYISTLKISLLGRILYACFSKRRKIAQTNINLVFGSTLNTHEQTKLAKAFFSHFGEICKELYWHNKKSFNPYIEIRGLEHVQKANQRGKGILFLTGHLGNWELVLLRELATHQDFNFHVLRKKQKNKAQSFLEIGYKNAGLKVIYPYGAIRKMIKILSHNQHIGFAFDQHAYIENAGIEGQFFGRKAGCSRTFPVLAKKTKACVLPMNIFRINNNHHVIEILPELIWINAASEEEEMQKNIQQYNQVLEQFILQHPEQWWWVHRRWKLNPEPYPK